MKIICALIILLSSAFIVEESPLPLNEEGKIEFEGVVQVEDLARDALFINAMNYGNKVKKASDRKPRMYANHQEGVVRKEGSFYVYTNGLFTPQVHGEILFNVELVVKDNQYTYRFSDFVFQHYKKNRYGVYAPVSGKKKPLEDEKYAGMQETWEEHKELTRQYIENHIRVLEKKMNEVPPGARNRQEKPMEVTN